MCCKKQTSSYHFENWSEDKSTIYFIFSILRECTVGEIGHFCSHSKIVVFFDDLLIQYGDFENCDFCSFSVVGDFMAIYSHLAILVVSIQFAIFWRFLKIAILGSVIFFGDLAYFSFLSSLEILWRFRKYRFLAIQVFVASFQHFSAIFYITDFRQFVGTFKRFLAILCRF